jgi:DNA-binding beta-propeller fold protein YncE
VIYTFTGNPAPSGVAIDSEGNYIVTEESTDIICKITLGGSRTVIFTFADDTDPWGVAIYPAIPAPVGGVATSVNKLEILTPYIALAGLIITVSTVYVIKRRKA